MEENRNTITYDENWQTVSESETPVIIGKPLAQEENDPPSVSKPMPKQLLLTVQLILCILIALAAFVLKNIGGEWYETAREWYTENLNNTAIFDNRESFNISMLTGKATEDEV